MWKLETPDKAFFPRNGQRGEDSISIVGSEGGYFLESKTVTYLPIYKTKPLEGFYKTKEEAQKALADFVADRNEKIKRLENLKKVYKENLRRSVKCSSFTIRKKK